MLAQIDTRGLAKQLGSKTTGDWFGNTGTTNPGAAKRMVRTAVGLQALPTVADALRAGEISAEHAAAIVTAMAAIDRVAPDLDAAVRDAAVATLLDVARVHAPYLVADKGRDLLLRFRPRETDTPAEDTTRNYSGDRPHPVGPHPPRRRPGRAHRGETAHRALPAGQTRARRRTAPPTNAPPPSATPTDSTALLDLHLDSGAGPTEGGVRPHVALTDKSRDLLAAKQQTPDPTRFCESRAVPPRMGGRDLAGTRAAAGVRLHHHHDRARRARGAAETRAAPNGWCRRVCAARWWSATWGVCAAAPPPPGPRPTTWSIGAQGGPTDLGNLALLCGRCHRELHRGYWELVMGEDGHPWIVPPKRIDEHRKPVPGYFRRTQQEAA